jgi:hypothetical protein
MESRELEIKEKWGPIKSQPDDKLKQVAKDIYNGLVFTDRHCREHEISQRFMVMMFMGPQPPKKPGHQSDSNTKDGHRDNAIYDIIQHDEDMKKWEEDMKWYDVECKYYQEEQVTSIGMIYEYLSEASPMGLNGGPIFMFLRILNKEDSTKVWEYYEKYKEIRETVDNF